MRSVTLLVLSIISLVNGAKILFFAQYPAKSHHAALRPIIIALASKGHQIVYYTPVPMENPPNNVTVMHIDLGSLGMGQFIKAGGQDVGFFKKAIGVLATSSALHDMVMKTEIVQNLLKSDEQFDLVVTVVSTGSLHIMGLIEKFGVPYVEMVPTGDMSWILDKEGAPENPSYMVDLFSPLSDQMNFAERLINTWKWLMNRVIYRTCLVVLGVKGIVEQYMNPGVFYMATKVHHPAIILVNSHPSVGYCFPKGPQFKEVGGLNVVENKTLPKDIKNFLDSATDGAIYFSFGSIVQVSEVADAEVRRAFVNVFRGMKQKILWKWEQDNFPDELPNVMTSKWFPQQDILAHPNLKVFITHGGLMSAFEAVSRGVPLFGIPFMVDQMKNINHARTYNYGIYVHFNNLTEKSLKWGLDELLYNPIYRNNAQRRAKLFHDRPLKPVDEAVFWMEHVLRHGPVFQPQSIFMPDYQLYLLDVTSFTIIIVLLILYLLRKFARFLLIRICGTGKRKAD